MPSLEMNRKLGLVEEGKLRSYERGENDKFYDIVVLSLLRSDWQKWAQIKLQRQT